MSILVRECGLIHKSAKLARLQVTPQDIRAVLTPMAILRDQSNLLLYRETITMAISRRNRMGSAFIVRQELLYGMQANHLIEQVLISQVCL